ncbi:MAG: bifunctional hydroxymethylpyrimidine kinase/phosphomethylpyrimidine kinase, partial [Clostridia bacterium]|nr:bifunctional hydroxymethylpyrimidine kinase/phosphomethylpyrimidine kinase [Clostridia bacterium]
TEVNDVSPEVSAEKQEELIKLVKHLSEKCDGLVLSGSLAKGMTADFYYKVLNAASRSLVKVVDSDGDRLIEALKCGIDLIKPNLEELENTIKKRITSKEEMLEGCREIIRMGAKYVLLSLGKKGAVITDGGKCYYCKSINVAMNSTVGAGDGMVAAATNALVKGESMQVILKCGVAGGTAAVTVPESISFTKDKYEEILSSLTVEEI